ncbi:patatin-like phospholipase domain-containing protein 4 isoform X2 [Cyclopterus lumpus]|uniref:patatin-like phospholipase domain-containing protein 4 isoform X2 n=1 Tax=Cyclopterus lumpus TaxID=8103 RepID=UPI0014870E6A|nr:patatin-like phospholipase domain-containing protein 4 isoform X2 [Cyclopterus lumpus]
MTILNLSFAACGFLGIYHLGAVGAILRHGDKLLGSLGGCAGASAGALVAAVLITAPEKLENCKEFTYRFADAVRQQRFGAVTPGYNFMLTLREGIEEILPSEAHSLATDRLHVSITHSKSGKNHIISKFTSREELIKALLASSYVPVYAGLKPVELRGQNAGNKCAAQAFNGQAESRGKITNMYLFHKKQSIASRTVIRARSYVEHPTGLNVQGKGP